MPERAATCVGMWREDVPLADGGFKCRQRKVKLGSVAEIPYRSQAEELLAVFMRQKPATRLTFSELVKKWKVAVAPTFKDSTASNYQYNAEKYLIPAFGSREVASLTRFDVESFLAAKASSYCRNTPPFVGGPKRMDTEKCLPRRETAESRQNAKRPILTAGQVALLVANVPEPISTLTLFLAVTGVRVGEAVGIKWSDFEGDALHIQRRIYERREGTPKTQSSDRLFRFQQRCWSGCVHWEQVSGFSVLRSALRLIPRTQ